MTITYVNGDVGSSDSEATTIAAAAINASAGNAIVVCISNYSSTPRTVSSIADTAGNSYARMGDVYNSGSFTVELWIAQNITGHATNVVTVTYSGAAGYRRAMVLQLSGVALSNAHDATFAPAGNIDSTSVYTTTAANTAVDGEMIIGVYLDESGGLTYSSSSPSVHRLSVSDGSAATNLIATAGSGSVSVTGNGNSAHWCYSKAIKPAAAASSILPVLMRQYRARRD